MTCMLLQHCIVYCIQSTMIALINTGRSRCSHNTNKCLVYKVHEDFDAIIEVISTYCLVLDPHTITNLVNFCLAFLDKTLKPHSDDANVKSLMSNQHVRDHLLHIHWTLHQARAHVIPGLQELLDKYRWRTSCFMYSMTYSIASFEVEHQSAILYRLSVHTISL